jgi:hypothetical protein
LGLLLKTDELRGSWRYIIIITAHRSRLDFRARCFRMHASVARDIPSSPLASPFLVVVISSGLGEMESSICLAIPSNKQKKHEAMVMFHPSLQNGRRRT